MAELSLDDVKRLLPKEFLPQLSKVFFCGNYGDPAAARDTLKIADYLRQENPALKIGIHSNGSLRTETWWRELAAIIGIAGYARFAIDGLVDTNHIYRQNTDWQKIMANARAFIAAGARAEWDFIVFAHNEHQVEEARELAQELGFVKFNAKRTGRFLRSGASSIAPTPIKSKDGATVGYLEPPTDVTYAAPAMEIHSGIACKAQVEQSIYLSAEGDFYPCCYLAAMPKNAPNPETHQHQKLVGKHIGKLRSGIREALDSEYFAAIPSLWQGEERLKVCARACGSR